MHVRYVFYLCKMTLNTFTGNIPKLACSSELKSSQCIWLWIHPAFHAHRLYVYYSSDIQFAH